MLIIKLIAFCTLSSTETLNIARIHTQFGFHLLGIGSQERGDSATTPNTLKLSPSENSNPVGE